MSAFFSSWSALIAVVRRERDADAGADRRPGGRRSRRCPSSAVDDPPRERRQPRPAACTGYCSTTNSSPPKRATTSVSRTIVRSRSATAISSRSPRGWPSVSLTCLNWSRSMKCTAHCCPRAHARQRVFHAVAQDGAVRQAGQRVVARQVVDLAPRRLALGDVLDEHHRCRHCPSAGTVNSSVRLVLRSRRRSRPSPLPRKARVEIVEQALGIGAATGRRSAAAARSSAALVPSSSTALRGRPSSSVQAPVRDHDAPLGVEHAQAVRHVVERGVEPPGEQRHVARRDHRVEQGVAQPSAMNFTARKNGTSKPAKIQ